LTKKIGATRGPRRCFQSVQPIIAVTIGDHRLPIVGAGFVLVVAERAGQGFPRGFLLDRLAAGAAALTAALIAAYNQILINQTLVSDC
jgi:hypothetical protein